MQFLLWNNILGGTDMTILWILLAVFAAIFALPIIVGSVSLVVVLAPYALIALIIYLIYKLFANEK